MVGKGKRDEGVDNRLVLTDRESTEHPRPIDLSMSALFGKLPKLSRVVESRKLRLPAFDNSLATYLPELNSGVIEEAVSRVLQLPAVASKMFLITIGVYYIFAFLFRILFRVLTHVSGAQCSRTCRIMLHPAWKGIKAKC